MQSSRRHPRTEQRDDRGDGTSMMSSSSRYHQDQCRTLRDRQAEDACTRIARHREARRQSDARAGPEDAVYPGGNTSTLPYGAGYIAFTSELRQVEWPRCFRPDLPVRYDGKINPMEFLNVYTTAVLAAGGNEKVLANWFPLALKPHIRSWLMNLPESSISSWADLCNQFVGAFQGGYKRPGIASDLHLLVQKPDESLRKYIQRFSQVQHNIPDISLAAVIATFHVNVCQPKMREKLNTCKVCTVAELFELTDKCARAEEGRHVPGLDTDDGANEEKVGTSEGTGKHRNRKLKPKASACGRVNRQENQGRR